MANIYSDSYLKIASADALSRVVKDRNTDQATRDKAKALLEQKSGGSSSSGSGTASSAQSSTASAPGKLIPAGSSTGSSSPSAGSAPGWLTSVGGGTTSKTGSAVVNAVSSGLPASVQVVQKSPTAGSGSISAGASGVGTAQTSGVNNPWVTGLDDRGQIDYSVALRNAMAQGADYDTVMGLYKGRMDKLAGDPSLAQYNDPAFDAEILRYLSSAQDQQFQQLRQQPQQDPYGDIMEQVKQYISQAQAATPSYEPSQWEKTAEALAQAALGMQYEDWTKSDQYAALADRYGLQGQQSMMDLLGQVSSRTGGLASSYATTAAQQQYNDYMAKLEEVARQMYAGERSDAIQNAQLAGQYSDRDYDRYLNQLAQYNRDRSFGFDVLSQTLADSRYNQEWQNKLEQQAYQREQDRYKDSLRWRDDARVRLEQYLSTGMSLEEMRSQFPDLIETSGYNNLELEALENYYAGLRQTGGSVSGSSPQKPEPEIFEEKSAPEYHSPGYKNVLSSISEIEDRALGDEAKIRQIARKIQSAQESGVISEAEARALLEQYGLKG